MPRGRRPVLSRERVLAGALELVDREGLDRFSMRRLGSALGVDPMAVYHHVPDQGALFDGLLELVYQETRIDPPTGDWQADVRTLARAFRAALLAHPNAVALVATRPPVTEGAFALVEAAHEALAPARLSPQDAADAVDCVGRLVIGHAIAEAGVPPDADGDAREEEHDLAQAALLAERFPRLAAAERAGVAHDPERLFALALDGLLLALDVRAAGAG